MPQKRPAREVTTPQPQCRRSLPPPQCRTQGHREPLLLLPSSEDWGPDRPHTLSPAFLLALERMGCYPQSLGGTHSLPAETQEDPSPWGPRNPAPSGASLCTPGSGGRPAGHRGPPVTSRNTSADVLDARWVPTASTGGVTGGGTRQHLASSGGDRG